MKYTLTAPLMIAPNLTPGVRIDDTYLTVAFTGRDDDNRVTTHCEIFGKAGTIYDGVGPSSGCGAAANDALLRELFASALSFVAYDGETYRYYGKSGLFSYDLTVAEWAAANSDEIEMLICELDSDYNNW
jgi:hypothetical protein